MPEIIGVIINILLPSSVADADAGRTAGEICLAAAYIYIYIYRVCSSSRQLPVPCSEGPEERKEHTIDAFVVAFPS